VGVEPPEVEPPPPPEESTTPLAAAQVPVVVGVVVAVVVVVAVGVPHAARFVVSLLTTVRPAGTAGFGAWVVVVFASVVVACLLSCLTRGLIAAAAGCCGFGVAAVCLARTV
jgi:hypothetical protein